MPTFVIQNKRYDTSKMEHIGTVRKWYEHESYLLRQLYGPGYGRKFDCELYRSAKGNFLLTHVNDCGQTVGQAILESEAKELLLSCNYDRYAALYGELEEA